MYDWWRWAKLDRARFGDQPLLLAGAALLLGRECVLERERLRVQSAAPSSARTCARPDHAGASTTTASGMSFAARCRCERVVQVVRRGVDRNRLVPRIGFAARSRVHVEGKRSGTNCRRDGIRSTGSTSPFMFSARRTLPSTPGCSSRYCHSDVVPPRLAPTTADRGTAAPMPVAMPTRRIVHFAASRTAWTGAGRRASSDTAESPPFGDGGSAVGFAQLLGTERHGGGETDEHDLREQPVDRDLDDEHHDRRRGPRARSDWALVPRLRASPTIHASSRTSPGNP